MIREHDKNEAAFAQQASSMQKPELLQLLLNYDEIVKKDPTNLQANIRAKIIMEVLSTRYEFKYLKEISDEYKRKIASRIYSQVQNQVKQASGS